MSARDLAAIGLVGALGYIAWKYLGGDMTNDNKIAPPAPSVGSSYLDKLAHAESSNNPFAKALTSSASGLYQFTKDTWIRLGGSWGDNPSLPFGGLNVSTDEQKARISQLTQQNSQILANAGVPVWDSSLYAAHFLGPFTAIKVLTAPATAMLTSLLSASTIAANPFLRNMTVADFRSWLGQKMG